MTKLVSEMTPPQSEIDQVFPLREMDDLELVEKCQQQLPRCMDAYRELVTRFESRVYDTCRRLVSDEKVAEQICEDAFIQVFHQIHQFQSDGLQSSLRIWIFQIVYRLCHLHLESGEAATASDAVPQDEMARALTHLEPEDRDWIVLRFVSELHVREIGAVLEVSRVESKEKLFQALSGFREACVRIAS